MEEDLTLTKDSIEGATQGGLDSLKLAEDLAFSQTMTTRRPKKQKVNPEIDWFHFETRMRKMISEMLDPIKKQSDEDREFVQNMRYQNQTLNYKIQDLETIAQKALSRSNQVDDANVRIQMLVHLLANKRSSRQTNSKCLKGTSRRNWAKCA